MKIQNNFFTINSTFDSVKDYFLDGLVGEERKAVGHWLEDFDFCSGCEENTLYRGGWYYGSEGFYFNPENGDEYHDFYELEEGEDFDRIASDWGFSEYPYIKEISNPGRDTEYFVVKDGKCLVVELMDYPEELVEAYEVLKDHKEATFYDFVSEKKVEVSFGGSLEEKVRKWISVGEYEFFEPNSEEDDQVYTACEDIYHWFIRQPETIDDTVRDLVSFFREVDNQ